MKKDIKKVCKEFTNELEKIILNKNNKKMEKDYFQIKKTLKNNYIELKKTMPEANKIDYYNTLWDETFKLIKEYDIKSP